MYTLYIPKYEGDSIAFAITSVIRSFVNILPDECNMLMAPGFMSTGASTIKHFIDELEKDTTGGRKVIYIGLFHGMNGYYNVSSVSPAVPIRDYHLNYIGASKHLREITISCKKRRDHRKMIFFCHYPGEVPSKIDKDNFEEYLRLITIDGILMGSSNQSDKTYYGGASGIADKGEADILMFESDAFAALIQGGNLPASDADIVLSKSIYPKEHDTQEFFKNIFRDYLNENLT